MGRQRPGPSGEPRDSAVLGVDETTDNGLTWTPAWSIPPQRWLYLAYAHEYQTRPAPKGLLASEDVLVRAVPGGHEVFVANGMEGLAVRDVDGSWSRVGVKLPETPTHGAVDIRPLPLASPGAATYAELAWVALWFSVALLALGGIAVRYHHRFRRGRGLVPVVTAVVLLGISGLVAPGSWIIQSPESSLLHAFVAAAVIIASSLSLIHRHFRLAVLMAFGSIAVGVVFYVPYFAWSLGWPQGYPRHAGTVSAIVAFAVVAVLVARAARRAEREPCCRTEQLVIDFRDGNGPR